MRTEADKINEVLETLGSPYRAVPHGFISETFYEVILAIPGYLDKKVNERVDAILRERGLESR